MLMAMLKCYKYSISLEQDEKEEEVLELTMLFSSYVFVTVANVLEGGVLWAKSGNPEGV